MLCNTSDIGSSGPSVPVNTKDAVNIIIANPPSEKIYRAVKVYVKHNVAFLAHTSTLIDWRDIWTDLVVGPARSGIKSFYFDIENENHAISTNEDDETQVTERYTYKHKSYPDFHKIDISLSKNWSCTPFNLFYVQYYFEGGEKDISFPYTYGNSKRDEPFKATTYSIRKEIKSVASKGKKGKEIIQCLTQSAGGFSKARAFAELPNSLNQIYGLCQKKKQN